MRKILKVLCIAMLASAVSLQPMTTFAQRRSGSSHSTSSSSSSSSNSSRSSSSSSRSSSSPSRSSGSSSSRSYSSPSRSSSHSSGSSSSSYGSSDTRRTYDASRHSSGSYGSSDTRRSHDSGRPSSGSSYQTQDRNSQRQGSSYDRRGYGTRHPGEAPSQGVNPSGRNNPSRGGDAARRQSSPHRDNPPGGGQGASPADGRHDRAHGAGPGDGRHDRGPGAGPGDGRHERRHGAAPGSGPRPSGPRHGHGPRVHPGHRDFIEHGRPAHFYRHDRHYYGYRIHSLPVHYVHHHYWGWDYYLCDGIYYRWYDGFYHVCRPPYGLLLDRALYDLELAVVNIAYYSTLNRTYSAINDNYRTIEEQNRIIAQNNAAIASQNSAVASSAVVADESYALALSLGLVQSYADASVQYYYDDGVFFVKDADGQYRTIVPPAGAIVDSLPDDYQTVTLGGAQYYQVDDTIYRMVIIEGKACFEVLGQIPQ